MTNKKVNNIINNLKETDSLYEDVITEIVEDSQDYKGETLQERLQARLRDIAYGLAGGTVGRLISTSDCVDFYQRYKDEINALLYEELFGSGLSLNELMPSLEEEDPLCLELHNQNQLAWFAYEIIAQKLANRLEE